jgi:hypothetical protein
MDMASHRLYGKSTVVRGSCPTYIFGRTHIWGGKCFLFSVPAVAHQRGEEDNGHGHGHGHHEKDARRDTNNTPPVCCCEPTHSAPKSRIARAPDVVDII